MDSSPGLVAVSVGAEPVRDCRPAGGVPPLRSLRVVGQESGGPVGPVGAVRRVEKE